MYILISLQRFFNKFYKTVLIILKKLAYKQTRDIQNS